MFSQNKTNVFFFIGYYVGYLDSAYFIGGIIASLLWSHLSDIYGRKRILLIGLVGSMLFTLLFGMSVNFWMALVTRFILT